MKHLARAVIMSATAFVSVTAPVAEAAARGHYHHARSRWHHHDYRNRDRAIAAGVVGLAAGAIIGGALAQQPRYPRHQVVDRGTPPYYPPPYVPQSDRIYRGGYEPWSPGWYDYCSRRFRSFNPRTGTFRGYDGLNHFCVVP